MIRLAQEKDTEAILALLRQVCHVHHRVRPDIFKDYASKFTYEELKEMIVKQESPIYVYVDEDDKVKGHLFLLIKVSDSPVQYPSKRLFIEDLCVDSSARGQRIGQQLCDFAKNLAIEWECNALTLNVWNDNASAYEFYDHLGFKPQQTQMELILSD